MTSKLCAHKQTDRSYKLKTETLKRVISISAGLLLLLHLFWPSLGIDLVSIALLFVVTLPWIGPVLKDLADSGVRNLELPGGIKIELADVKSATDKVIRGHIEAVIPMAKVSASATVSPPEGKIEPSLSPETFDPLASIKEVADADANLGLVAFRIEIEKRLRSVAEANDIKTHRIGLSHLVRQLQQKQVLSVNMASGLLELIGFGNRAAHGVEVSEEAAAWVLDVGPAIILELDAITGKLTAHNQSFESDA